MHRSDKFMEFAFGATIVILLLCLLSLCGALVLAVWRSVL